ncbi:MAG: type II secretion system F family protein [Gammaproteobacteria bacterium]|nr:type II secretion system F family protein [Gammaproteobacteria bacterium]
MAIFRYQGRNRSGQKVIGQLEANSKEAVAKHLQASGIIPIAINADVPPQHVKDNGRESGSAIGFGRNKLKIDDLIFFSRQMYTLTKSSVPILSALDGLVETSENKRLKKAIQGIRRSLDEGYDLTGAMQRQNDVFSRLYISLVRIGETSGKLDEIFSAIAYYLQKEKDTRDKVKSALMYPITVMIVVTIGLVVANLFVLPAFVELYKNFNATLPIATRILISFSEYTRMYGYYVAGGLLGFIVLMRAWLSTYEGRFFWHRRQYRIPVVGSLLKQSSVSRFAHAMSITYRAGVPMEQSLRIIGPVVGNLYMEQQIATMHSRVERGESVTRAATHAGIFPSIVIQMIHVGEESGTLDEMLTEVAEYYEREIDQSIKMLSAALEPLIIIFIAVIVTILALGVFLPMISLLGAIK